MADEKKKRSGSVTCGAFIAAAVSTFLAVGGCGSKPQPVNVALDRIEEERHREDDTRGVGTMVAYAGPPAVVGGGHHYYGGYWGGGVGSRTGGATGPTTASPSGTTRGGLGGSAAVHGGSSS